MTHEAVAVVPRLALGEGVDLSVEPAHLAQLEHRAPLVGGQTQLLAQTELALAVFDQRTLNTLQIKIN